MRKLLAATVLAIALTGAIPSVPAAAATKPPKVTLTISNFRYCKAASCTPLDMGYLRPDNAPVGDNPLGGTVSVKSGSLVSWVYHDDLCDSIDGCTGHNIYFENGKPTGVRKGFVPSNKGAKAINVLITQKKGTTIRYFCTVNSHYQTGMTGILKVT
jgi:hypothetical protein